MKRKLFFILMLMLLLTATVLIAADEKHNVKPKEGYVPDEKTAIRIAVAVWIPIYGEKKIEEEKPYRAKLENGIWTVQGSLHGRGPIVLGGTAIAEIAKDDGRILRISHGK